MIWGIKNTHMDIRKILCGIKTDKRTLGTLRWAVEKLDLSGMCGH